ncbi:hypothetical protein FB45DRAFT_870514 [Roridomyces roridus]|uniref:Uncharacterized protein n=1 Tax=Roridomyces roridus TaxID=1738132 RepID=A0AAD7BIL3_9AGAR|nr:hypothetical protein FB45DRAFT_870514 [Roridomyces roridus]
MTQLLTQKMHHIGCSEKKTQPPELSHLRDMEDTVGHTSMIVDCHQTAMSRLGGGIIAGINQHISTHGKVRFLMPPPSPSAHRTLPTVRSEASCVRDICAPQSRVEIQAEDLTFKVGRALIKVMMAISQLMEHSAVDFVIIRQRYHIRLPRGDNLTVVASKWLFGGFKSQVVVLFLRSKAAQRRHVCGTLSTATIYVAGKSYKDDKRSASASKWRQIVTLSYNG